MLDGIKMLLSPDMPLWVKIAVVLVGIAALWVWWTEPYWHNLNRPDREVAERQARPPFEL